MTPPACPACPSLAADRDALLSRVAVLEAELHDRDLRIAGHIAEARRQAAEIRRLVGIAGRSSR